MILQIEQRLNEALQVLKKDGIVPDDVQPPIRVRRSCNVRHGDFASNLAMMLARPAGRAPIDIAKALVAALPASPDLGKVEIAGPGFINFYQPNEMKSAIVATVLEQAERFGRSELGAGKRVQVELVLASTSSGLCAGSGRTAVIGEVVSRLLDAIGFVVEHVSKVDFACESAGGNRQRHIDAGIKDDLAMVGVRYDQWSSERSIAASIDHKMHADYEQVLSVLSCDQCGYKERMLEACDALGYSQKKLRYLHIPCGTHRQESCVTMRKLCHAVGKDALRYFYVMRKYSQPLDSELKPATSHCKDNPVYNVQFAHARICSVMRQLNQQAMAFDKAAGLSALGRLSEKAETDLMRQLAVYPELLQRAALAHEPHQLTGYLRDLGNGLHSYYHAQKVLVDDHELRHARVCLLLAVRQVLSNGLSILDVSAPEVM